MAGAPRICARERAVDDPRELTDLHRLDGVVRLFYCFNLYILYSVWE